MSIRPAILALSLALAFNANGQTPIDAQASKRAQQLAQDALIVDTHIDAPGILSETWADLGVAAPDREFDYPRAREGGLDVAFMSIYTSPGQDRAGTARELAHKQIDAVECGRVHEACPELVDHAGLLRQTGHSKQQRKPVAAYRRYRRWTRHAHGVAMSAQPSNTPRRVENLQTDKGRVPVYATGIVEQPWVTYSADDHATWATLYARQRELLVGRACDEFLQAQDAMGMTPDAIPKFSELNQVLEAATGWTLMGVEGLLPELDFFDHLANRRFPVTWWIRRPDQIDYIEEPDLFHDLFGHVPLLMNPVFADYMEAYGKGGVKAHGIGPDALQNLTRLYWYTVEFGLIQQADGLRIFGAGIVSSKGESIYSLESDAPNRIGFDLERIMRTRYRIDTYQKTYFVIDSFEQLMDATRPDFTPIYARLATQDTVGAGTVREEDRVFHRGTGEGWTAGGDV